MRVQVDQAGRDDVALHVAHFRGAAEIVADFGDLAARERHVGDAVDVLRGIDDPPALQDEIVGHVSRHSGGRKPDPMRHDFSACNASISRSMKDLPHFSSSVIAIHSSALCA